MRLLLLLLFTAFPVVGFGQEPLVVESTQRRDTPFRLEHPEGAVVKAIFAKVDSSGNITWAFLSDSHFIREKTVTYMAAPPGEYLITVGGSQIVKVIEEGKPNPRPEPPRPEPEPTPEPQPQPEPEPDTDRLKIDWAVWVEESADRNKYPEEQQVMFSAELWQYLGQKNINRFVYDEEIKGAEPWLKFAGGTRPALILFQQEPQKYLTFPAPKSVQEAKKLIEDYSK